MIGLQVQHSMQQQEQTPKGPLQPPLRQQSICSSPKQASNLSEQRALSAADASETEHGSFADLIKEAADAKHQVHFAAACPFIEYACVRMYLDTSVLMYSVYRNAVHTRTCMCSTCTCLYTHIYTHITLKT